MFLQPLISQSRRVGGVNKHIDPVLTPKILHTWAAGGTPTLTYGQGLDSVTRNATGNYTLNFSTDFTSTEFFPSMNCDTSAGQGVVSFQSRAVGSVSCLTSNTNAVLQDYTANHFICWGDQ